MARVQIGNAQNRIVVYLDKQDALDLADCLLPEDGFGKDLRMAAEQAYPAIPPESEEGE